MVGAPMQGSAYTPPPFSLSSWADPAYTPLPSGDVADPLVTWQLTWQTVLATEASWGL